MKRNYLAIVTLILIAGATTIAVMVIKERRRAKQ